MTQFQTTYFQKADKEPSETEAGRYATKFCCVLYIKKYQRKETSLQQANTAHGQAGKVALLSRKHGLSGQCWSELRLCECEDMLAFLHAGQSLSEFSVDEGRNVGTFPASSFEEDGIHSFWVERVILM